MKPAAIEAMLDVAVSSTKIHSAERETWRRAFEQNPDLAIARLVAASPRSPQPRSQPLGGRVIGRASAARKDLDRELADLEGQIAAQSAAAKEHQQAAAEGGRDGLAAHQVFGDLTAEHAATAAAETRQRIAEQDDGPRHAEEAVLLLTEQRGQAAGSGALAEARDDLSIACDVANDASISFALRPAPATADRLIATRADRDAALVRYEALQAEHGDRTPLPQVLDEPQWLTDRKRVADLYTAGPERPLECAARKEAERAKDRQRHDVEQVQYAARKGEGLIRQLPERLQQQARDRRAVLLAEKAAAYAGRPYGSTAA